MPKSVKFRQFLDIREFELTAEEHVMKFRHNTENTRQIRIARIEKKENTTFGEKLAKKHRREKHYDLILGKRSKKIKSKNRVPILRRKIATAEGRNFDISEWKDYKKTKTEHEIEILQRIFKEIKSEYFF